VWARLGLGGSWQVCQLYNSAFACCSSLFAAGLAAGTLSILFLEEAMPINLLWHHGCWWEWKFCCRRVHRPQLPCFCKIEPWVASSFVDWCSACGEWIFCKKDSSLNLTLVFLCSTGLRCCRTCCACKLCTTKFWIWISKLSLWRPTSRPRML